MIVISHHNRAR